MYRINSFGNKRCHHCTWLIVAAITVLIEGAGASIAQEKQDGKPANVATGNEDITPKPFGKPLVIDLGDDERTIYLYEGRSTADSRDPAHMVYYHGLDLALVPLEKPLPGFPAWVQRAINRDNETVMQVRFRLSSPKLRAACEAKLLSDERAYLDKQSQHLGVPAIKVEVQRVPAYELLIAIQDSATELTLAYAKFNVTSLSKDVIMSFRFNSIAFAQFFTCYKEGTLQFKPYYKIRSDQIVTAEKQTTIDYSVGLKVKQLLDHRQQAKQNKDDENTILPILQGDVNRISRQVTMDIKSKIIGAPEVITFLQNDTLLVASCFDPANTMDFDTFSKTFKNFTQEMLLEYLKPCGVTKYQGKSTKTAEGKQHTDEKTKKTGGGDGFGFSLGPVSFGSGGQTENTDRVLDTIYNATGIRLTDGGMENYYKPAEIKVYKLANGVEERKLSQASSITLTKGPLNSYLEESPFPQTYVVKTVDESLDKTLNKNDHVARLLAKKAKLQTALDTELAKIDKAESNLKTLAGSINDERRKLHEANGAFREPFGIMKQQIGNVEFSRLIRGSEFETQFFGTKAKVTVETILRGPDFVHGWTWTFNPDADIKNRESTISAEKGKADALDKLILNKSKSLDEMFVQLATQDATIQKSTSEITSLRGEIAKLDKEILSILER
jgi:peptidoglycan hydrolase CwlO-like protein